jgi:hypothetical protein
MIRKFAGITQVFIYRSLSVSRGFPAGVDREIFARSAPATLNAIGSVSPLEVRL